MAIMAGNQLYNKCEMYIMDNVNRFFSYIEKDWERIKTAFLEQPSLKKFLLLGIAIRLALAPFLGHPYDLRIFMAVGRAVANGMTPYGQYVLQMIFPDMDHPHLYGSFYGIGYPPTWGLILGSLADMASAIQPGNIYAYVLALKLPIIVGDVAISILLFVLLESEMDGDVAFKVFRFYMLCPFLIVVGAVWGMFDVLVTFFAVLSVQLVFKKSGWSALSLGFASSLKPYTIVLAPLYSIFIFKKVGSVKKSFQYLFLVLVFLALLTLLPMMIFGWPLSNLYYALSAQMSTTDLYSNYENEITYGAASPFNIFNVLRLGFPLLKPPDFLNYLWIPACFCSYVYTFLSAKGADFRTMISYSFLTSTLFFATRFWVSEQNLVFLLTLFVLTVMLNRTPNGWGLIHPFWILLFAFVLVHVPAPGFLWIVEPWALTAATAFCNGSYGYLRWIAMSALTLSWLGILFWYSFREGIARRG